MPAPRATNHRAAREGAITIIREYEPDPARCVQALLSVLAYQPKNANAGAANFGDAIEGELQRGTAQFSTQD
jgi:hypothetical protein